MSKKTINDLPEATDLPKDGECLFPIIQEYMHCKDGTVIPVPLYKISFLNLVKAIREKIDENYDVKMIYGGNTITFRLKGNDNT